MNFVIMGASVERFVWTISYMSDQFHGGCDVGLEKTLTLADQCRSLDRLFSVPSYTHPVQINRRFWFRIARTL